VGQAAFTVTIVVLFNLLAPAGWTVGLLRVEDVALGCAVSLVVGVLAWPRGASGIVGDDLADTFRTGAEYLLQAVDWALSELMTPPAGAAPAVAAGLRLDDAVRGFLAEQGSKKASKEDLWALVTASTRLRLTANTLSGLRQAELIGPDGPTCLPLPGSNEYAGEPACTRLRSVAAGLAVFYGQVADELERPPRADAEETATEAVSLAPPPLPKMPDAPGADGAPDGLSEHEFHPHLLWIYEHLHQLAGSAQTIGEPAVHIAEARRRPWWR
jgi:hypothetical protein